jgi:hypothetical protein
MTNRTDLGAELRRRCSTGLPKQAGLADASARCRQRNPRLATSTLGTPQAVKRGLRRDMINRTDLRAEHRRRCSTGLPKQTGRAYASARGRQRNPRHVTTSQTPPDP